MSQLSESTRADEKREKRRRKKRIALLKKIFSGFLSLSLIAASLYLWHSLPVLETFAAPEKEFTEVEKALLGLASAGQSTGRLRRK